MREEPPPFLASVLAESLGPDGPAGPQSPAGAPVGLAGYRYLLAVLLLVLLTTGPTLALVWAGATALGRSLAPGPGQTAPFITSGESDPVVVSASPAPATDDPAGTPVEEVSVPPLRPRDWACIGKRETGPPDCRIRAPGARVT